MSEPEIRVAKEGDLLQLLQLFSRADEGLNPPVSNPKETEASTWAEMLSADHLTTYVALLEGELVGTALFVSIPNPQDSAPHTQADAKDGAHAFYRSVGFESEAEGFRLYL